MIRRGIATLAVMLLLSLAGCGGGGSTTSISPTGGGSSGGGDSSTGNRVSGIAARASTVSVIERNRPVKVFAVNDSGEQFLDQSTTGTNGNYAISVGSYSGPIVVKVYDTNGTTVLWRAALPSVGSSTTLAVTPLTELAVRYASNTSSTLTRDVITSSNSLISDMFNLDITSTQPVELTASAFITTNQLSKNYALALAALAQQGAGSTLEPYLADLISGAPSRRFTPSTATAFITALQAFLDDPLLNSTGISSIPVLLQAVGDKTYYAKLSVTPPDNSGVYSGGGYLKGISFTMTFPRGVTLRTNSTDVLEGVVSSSLSGSYIAVNYLPESSSSLGSMLVGYVKSTFGTGEFLTVECNYAPGVEPNTQNFSISTIEPVASGGVTVSDITINLVISTTR